MQVIKSKDTSIEIILRKELWSRGIRYRKKYKNFSGTPDIVINKYKIVILCDSEFFYGKNWNVLAERLKKSSNSKFWIRKIQNNIIRDNNVNVQLENLGYTVLRFWGNKIKKDVSACVNYILFFIKRND
ncbi:MAG: very short patch repair endonuclease [Anaeroplasmataceae bacterium]|nr:very short patch repair endonuclease [Anaeroplasmataceae bacterium]